MSDLIETAKPKETAFVLHPYLKGPQVTHTDEEYKLEELSSLTQAIDLSVIHTQSIALPRKIAATLIGKGIVEDIKSMIEDQSPNVVIVNGELSPAQQRNLERAWGCKVIDRVGLILEIFGARAQTNEGRLQVELAALEYQKSRLVRSWTHLERQRGGAGFMGGPGERQIELDRRMITDRITMIKQDIEKLKQNRALQRRSRGQKPYPIIALVGYTNAGKSTLFNALTNAEVMAKDMLFATLDTTMRRLQLPNGQTVILSDTVGFISDLPTHLIAAFRATLEELKYADIVLHVQDISSDVHDVQKQDVEDILKDFGIEEKDTRLVEVYNKIDALTADKRDELLRFMKSNEVAVSAITGEGLDNLQALIQNRLEIEFKALSLQIPYKEGKALAWLHENGIIREERHNGENTQINVDLHPRDIGKFKQLFPSLAALSPSAFANS